MADAIRKQRWRGSLPATGSEMVTVSTLVSSEEALQTSERRVTGGGVWREALQNRYLLWQQRAGDFGIERGSKGAVQDT
eukprot:scaffold793_cov161-Amphora_coffeaeformis.AAC.4